MRTTIPLMMAVALLATARAASAQHAFQVTGTPPATRVAVLNFGAPLESGEDQGVLGIGVTADAFRKAIEPLLTDRTQVVAIRVNSSGGYHYEVARFHEVLENEFEPRFRTVAWIDSALSASAVCVYALDEMYFTARGEVGACTWWFGGACPSEKALKECDELCAAASRLGHRERAIMQSMQGIEGAALSVDIDPETGRATWRRDVLGATVLNRPGEVLVMHADTAIATRFARAIANTREELAAAMDLGRVEWVGEEANAIVLRSMRAAADAEKTGRGQLTRYLRAAARAESAFDVEARREELAAARRSLKGLLGTIHEYPHLAWPLGATIGVILDEEWGTRQVERLDALERGGDARGEQGGRGAAEGAPLRR